MDTPASAPAVKGVLVDLAGVVYQGDALLPGAAQALARLGESGARFRFLTNTTRATRRSLVERLLQLGLSIEEKQVFSAPQAARRLLEQRSLRPFLLVHPGLLPEFKDLSKDNPNAVLIGDAGPALTYERLNEAFRLLMNGAPLISMGRNRYFREASGLSLDAGPFAAALEFASGVHPEVVGKPDREFFHLALSDIGCAPEESVMIGDDVHDDVCGAIAAGLRGILVQTGKYRPGDEKALTAPSGAMAKDIAAAVEKIIGGS